MKKHNLSNVARNIAALVFGIIIYLITDTVIGVLAGVLLNTFTQIENDTIYFQIVLKFIVAASNARLITLAVNYIAVRNSKGYNIPEYLISATVIFITIGLTVLNWSNHTLDASGIIFCVFNLLLGVVLFFDAKEEMI